MAFCTLLKGDFLPWSSELLADYEILLDVGMRYLRDELIILSDEIIELLADIRIILQLVYPISPFLPWRVSLLIIVLIHLMPMLARRRDLAMIDNGNFDVLQKETCEMLCLK